ncbi:flagellar motor protein MotB [Paraferrimonas sedimenticola]|uniref:Flagellar motor protein MotB n=1 Tax=Paraferrimonas sedimenticola TaxID=375674 RepID=A0AA37RY32_9GAMM|nr:flagellar motor protein MotB [Paraferrimonas sedimenticola]GLP96812.1 flagellar motor protein MotB [Paraferrimonas sedimenticola]
MAKKCKCPPPGAPAWMATFADLMSLLMCFFVLLLAFSEMDVLKFKQIAGSMKYAFGVQNQLEIKDIPKGTSVIALEFRPGRPDPTPIDIINQKTERMTQQTLEYQPGEDPSSGGLQFQQGLQRGGSSDTAKPNTETASKKESHQVTQEQVNRRAKKLAEQLRDQIVDGALEVESLGQQIIIRIREKGSFSSGSGFLQPQFRPIVQKVARLLNDVPGQITVTGHTDDVRISNELYSSNWDLSSKRALAVAHAMISVKGFDENRLLVRGMAQNQPLVANDGPVNRARNRRVEISIMQGKAMVSEEQVEVR